MSFLMKSQKAMLHQILEQNRFNPADFAIVVSVANARSHDLHNGYRHCDNAWNSTSRRVAILQSLKHLVRGVLKLQWR
jgi:hypothetical protein